MKKLPLFVITLSIFFCLLIPTLFAAEKTWLPVDGNLTDITGDDPYYYTSDQVVDEEHPEKEVTGLGRVDETHSKIPHLPIYSGYMSTNYTYRFVNVVEETFTMIGEGKHGLWRVQDNGTIREYRKEGAKGLPPDADLFAKENLATINNQYKHYLPKESWSGYKHPHQRIGEDGNLNFIDLPITHPKYKGKYAEHVPIDLPHFYCTMSANRYPYSKLAVHHAFDQPAAGKVGPLGTRAGLDVNELYTRVLRLEQFPDARAWVNVGGEDEHSVNWQAVDINKTNAEFYLIERPFFNEPYLFVTAVFDNPDNQDFQYVRPAGPYYESLNTKEVKSEVTHQPRFHLENGEVAQAKGLPIYGVHHPNRAAFGGGGACPLKGGDWSNYPKTTGAAGWPTNYEEITPLCDGVLVDIKFFANLSGVNWNDPNAYLANAGHGTAEVNYTVQPGEYGVYTDPYNVERGAKNPDAMEVPENIKLKYPSVQQPITPVDE